MRKRRFTEAQIIGMIREQADCLATAEVGRKHRLSPASVYKLKAKYGGIEVSDAKRLKQLEDEIAKIHGVEPVVCHKFTLEAIVAGYPQHRIGEGLSWNFRASS